ncbi:Vps51/Vps67-domain-containing protein [Phyllosticta citrichinensis]|uniref:Vacuolar protein sorting-associated protein 51 homolog n=1 Tax=Phyllosticta citrichinensis TaxID=1130410 RepID=A0ABR1Y1R5_9PEZI
MSTIASPRHSSSIRSPSSTRTSLEVPSRSNSLRSTSKTRPPRARDRTALRDYYNLKSPLTPTSDPSSTFAAPPTPGLGGGFEAVKEEVEASELDRPGFDAEAYVKEVLGKEGLEGVLKVEAGLVAQVKGLDGERKALVYDNYSKLIAATETIKKMRTNMDPLTPHTSTLGPAIAHIAETATALSVSIIEHAVPPHRIKSPSPPGIVDDKERQRQTVRWVLDTPRRLRSKVARGDKAAAAQEFEEVEALLQKWEGVKGVDELRKECREALAAGAKDVD